MHYQFAAINPFRATHWRWSRACSLVDQEKKPRRAMDDRWIGMAHRFCKAQRAAITEDAAATVINRYPLLHIAWTIWNAQSDNELMLKHEIEARLLANQRISEISSRAGVPDEVIDLYEKLFFNVLDRLTQRAYIVHQVIGAEAQTGLTPKDPAMLWKLYGYYCGPLAVDFLVELFPDPIRPLSRSQLESWSASMTKQTIARKALVAAQTLRASGSYEQLDLVDKFLKMTEIAASGSEGAGGSNAFADNVEAMLNEIPWSVGGVNTRLDKVATTITHHYDARGVELSPEELMLISTGYSPTTIDVEGAVYPTQPLIANTSSEGTPV